MNKLIEKIGIEKVAHFGMGGLICALMTFIFMLQEGVLVGWGLLVFPVMGNIVTFILSYIKEAAIDEEFSWKDILAAMLGCVTVYLAVLIGIIFCILSL